MDECQALRVENADLVDQLELARNPTVVEGYERLEATLRVGPAAPATARAALTRWLSGHVPIEVLDDARLLASELVTNSLRHPEIPRDASLRLAVQLREGALRVEVRDPGTSGVVAPREADREYGGGFGLQLVDKIATRWGINRTGGTQVWFEVDAAGATD
jgi:anti-sigma regulatory factor (Ser/Thr protein kinase)